MRAELDRGGIAALSGGHGAVDFASGAVPALLPFLAERFDLSYTLTALLMLSATVSSSLVQPLFGLLSDRRGAMWLLPAGVLVAGAGIALAGVAPSYGLALAAVFVAGLGIAAYHPEGAKFASYASGQRRASGMSLFNVGGNTGYALGPIIITPIVLWLGLTGTLVAALPVLVVGMAIILVLPYLRDLRPTAASRAVAGEDRPRAMAVLIGVILLRTTTWFGLITFVPLWVVSLGHSKADGNRLLSLMLVAGVAGALVLGPVADRVGLRRTLLATTAGAAAPGAHLRLRRRYRGRGRPHARRRLRGGDVRRRHGAEPALSAAARRAGLRAQRRARGRSRRCRRGRARRGGRRGRSRDGADDLRGDSGLRGGPVPAPAVAAGAACPGTGGCVGLSRSIEPSVKRDAGSQTRRPR